jgi:uncharacterized protein YciW
VHASKHLTREGIVRYADDFVVGFQHESDAVKFHQELRERFRKFNLELHAEKTRVIEFGRFTGSVPGSTAAAVASNVEPAQSERPAQRNCHEPDRRVLARKTANPSTLPHGALCRYDPRQEPGAVVPLAGICAGGDG